MEIRVLGGVQAWGSGFRVTGNASYKPRPGRAQDLVKAVAKECHQKIEESRLELMGPSPPRPGPRPTGAHAGILAAARSQTASAD